MTWAVIQSASAEADGSTVSKAFTTSNVLAGSKIIVVAGRNSDTGTPTCHDGASNAWTFLGESLRSGTGCGVDLFALDVPAGDVGTKPTITVTRSGNFGWGITILEVSGLLPGNTTDMLDGTPGTLGGTAASTGSATYASTAPNQFLLSAYGDQGDGNTVVKATGWTMVGNNGSTDANSLAQYKDSSGGTETDGFTSADTGGWGLLTVAFKLVIPGTDSSPAYATSVSDLGDGTGSWVNTADAEGSPDASYATWTA